MKRRAVSEKEKSEIRSEYRDCLKRFSRPELISTYSAVGINDNALINEMIRYSGYTDKQLLQMILERDVENTVQILENGWNHQK